MKRLVSLFLFAILAPAALAAHQQTLVTNVNVVHGTSDKLHRNMNVLVEHNLLNQKINKSNQRTKNSSDWRRRNTDARVD
jgi:uncharacterized membrane protein